MRGEENGFDPDPDGDPDTEREASGSVATRCDME
jgi:hypothetical protein